MCEEVWDLVKLYTSPDDYAALVCVSRHFRDVFTTIKGPVMLRNLLLLDVGFPRNMKISSANELTWVLNTVFGDRREINLKYINNYVDRVLWDLQYY